MFQDSGLDRSVLTSDFALSAVKMSHLGLLCELQRCFL